MKDLIYRLIDGIALTGDRIPWEEYTQYIRYLGPLRFYSEREYGHHTGQVTLALFGRPIIRMDYDVYHYYWDNVDFYQIKWLPTK